MRTELAYSASDDQELYRQGEIQVGQMAFTIKAATIASMPTKPNEDSFAVAADTDTFLAAVFDGTTSLKPIAALQDQTGAHFASHFLKDHLADAEADNTPEQILLKLNEDLLVESIQLGGALADTHTLPASLATIVKISDNARAFEFAHAGDTFGIVYYKDGHSEVFTGDTNKKFDNQVFKLLTETARAKGISYRQARDDDAIKRALINIFTIKNNHPNGEGSGVVNGDPNLALYIQTGTVTLQGVSAILLATDGLLPPGWSLESEQDRQRMIAALQEGGFRRLFGLKHQAEDEDPDWNHVRFKHSDDATGLLIIRTAQDA